MVAECGSEAVSIPVTSMQWDMLDHCAQALFTGQYRLEFQVLTDSMLTFVMEAGSTDKTEYLNVVI